MLSYATDDTPHPRLRVRDRARTGFLRARAGTGTAAPHAPVRRRRHHLERGRVGRRGARHSATSGCRRVQRRVLHARKDPQVRELRDAAAVRHRVDARADALQRSARQHQHGERRAHRGRHGDHRPVRGQHGDRRLEHVGEPERAGAPQAEADSRHPDAGRRRRIRRHVRHRPQRARRQHRRAEAAAPDDRASRRSASRPAATC